VNTYYCTFGRKSVLHFGWVRIEAPNFITADNAARDQFGEIYAKVYLANAFEPRWFPAGEIFAFRTDAELNYQPLRRQLDPARVRKILASGIVVYRCTKCEHTAEYAVQNVVQCGHCEARMAPHQLKEE